MNMMMLLLVSAVVLLVSPPAASPAPHKPDDNLNRIIDLAEKYNESIHKEYFVEDVSHLAESACGDKFFCKVYEILDKHKNISIGNEKAILRNLKTFLTSRNANCTELLKNVTSTGVKKPIPELVTCLTECIRRRNFRIGNR